MTKYNAKEASKKLGLSYAYLLRLVRGGKIQHHRLTERKIFFTDADIEAIENSCAVMPKN